ncbi:DUF2339 domain-containing protein [Pseudorhodoplanes sp.]|uniref:DUF2339 domain-containing protein n=1 Tax=Pseudorhodoplanes sp. TaxID=1934341 RepID=UPI002B74B136|nr:DUF2339 domain-containing protein [Pseudorhodoplanes sp.]HWV42809.1 DUF2339 domain-containing protein [Pseudorhodoplanes sp.]
MEFFGFVTVALFLIFVMRVRSRLSALEASVNRLNELILNAAPEPAGRPVSAPPPQEPFEPAAPVASIRPSPDDIAAPEAGQMSEKPVDETASSEAPPEASAAAPGYGDFERRFGTQWVVWIGGLALALGGIFLVRYTIEAGLIGPRLRIMLGGLLAAALVGLGEYARRRETLAGFARFNTAHIPSVLTAAGTTIAYAVIYAAFALYDFLSPATAFVLLGAVALATLAAALLHGPALAGLGLIGAFVTPALIGSAQPNYLALYLYLAVVTAAAFLLARARLWRWLAIATAVFSFVWLVLPLGAGGALYPQIFHVLVGFALAAALIASGVLFGPDAQAGRLDLLSSGVLASYVLGALLLVFFNRHGGPALVALFVLCAATIAAAWRSESVTPALGAAAIAGILVVAHWSVSDYFVTVASPGGPYSAVPPVAKLEGLRAHVVLGTGLTLMFGAAGYLAQGRLRHPYAAMIWAGMAVLTPLAMLIALYYGITGFVRSIPFAGVALLLAALFAIATEGLTRRKIAAGDAAASAVFAAGAVAALALTLTFTLERGWLTVAFALMVPGLAYVADKRPLPLLRLLCVILVALVMARIVWEPRIVGDDVGRTPILNWLLWGYGVPALAFWLGARILRRRADDFASRSVESAAITFTALTFMLQIRHFMNDGDIYRPSASLAELGLQVSTALAMTIGLERVRLRTNSIVHEVAALIIGILALFGALISTGIQFNPVFTNEPVGGPFFNVLLLGYAIPAILMAILARMFRETRPALAYVIAAVAAIILALVYLTLEVRRIFHGPMIGGFSTSDAEQYTYSAVWLVFGVALLLAGIALKSQPARFASAAVVLLTVGKVFLYDLAGVQGVFRALSLICLGLTLMGIGWLYQRLLFPPRSRSETTAGPVSA